MRKKETAAHYVELRRMFEADVLMQRFERRLQICRFAVEWLYKLIQKSGDDGAPNKPVTFSVVGLLNDMKAQGGSLFGSFADLQLEEVKEALLYLAKIGALKLDGGFLVIYNAMHICGGLATKGC